MADALSGVALVTGGGRGIGASIARELAAAGMEVAVTGRTAAQVEAVAQEVGGRALVGDVHRRLRRLHHQLVAADEVSGELVGDARPPDPGGAHEDLDQVVEARRRVVLGRLRAHDAQLMIWLYSEAIEDLSDHLPML